MTTIQVIKDNGHAMPFVHGCENILMEFLRDVDGPVLVSLETPQSYAELELDLSGDMLPHLTKLDRLLEQGESVFALKAFMQSFGLPQIEKFSSLFIGAFRTRDDFVAQILEKTKSPVPLEPFLLSHSEQFLDYLFSPDNDLFFAREENLSFEDTGKTLIYVFRRNQRSPMEPSPVSSDKDGAPCHSPKI